MLSVEQRYYLDTMALAKWYLNEVGSEAFVDFLQGLRLAFVSSLTVTELRSLLSRRRRMVICRLIMSRCFLKPSLVTLIMVGC